MISFFFRCRKWLGLFGILSAFLAQTQFAQARQIESGTYTLVVEGFDWGPAANKVILSFSEFQTKAIAQDFSVDVKRNSPCGELDPKFGEGKRKILRAYVCDTYGNKAEKAKFVALEMEVGPDLELDRPIHHEENDKCQGNVWIDYQLLIRNVKTMRLWDSESDRIMPLIDDFDLSGSYRYNDELTLSYAYFEPEGINKEVPLIIWLHGGGEGGFEPSIPLVANRAANYASPEIQKYFGKAHVLVPQCPGAWMDNEQGTVTWGRENDMYNESLMGLIKHYVSKNPKIDKRRIYIGGCSNGGYMSLKLMLLYPNYFAAGYISALAYRSEFLSDHDINRLSKMPIWFIHSKDDQVTYANETAIPVFKRLKDSGAANVHLSLFDHVVDVSGIYGGDSYYYDGHWSWIYSHVNKSRLDFDGTPVMIKNQEVTIIEWLAFQRNNFDRTD